MKRHPRKCSWCGKEFHSHRAKAVAFCGRACRDKSERHPKPATITDVAAAASIDRFLAMSVAMECAMPWEREAWKQKRQEAFPWLQ